MGKVRRFIAHLILTAAILRMRLAGEETVRYGKWVMPFMSSLLKKERDGS